MEWSDPGVEGAFRLRRVWRTVGRVIEFPTQEIEIDEGRMEALERKVHQTIFRVTRDIREKFHFNTAINSLMELLNEMIDYVRFLEEKRASFEEKEILVFASRTLVSLLNPIAPHLSEELWQLGEKRLAFHRELASFHQKKKYTSEKSRSDSANQQQSEGSKGGGLQRFF